MGKAYIHNPDLGDQVGEISDHPDVINYWKARGFEIVAPPEGHDESVNGPVDLSQDHADAEVNGPGVAAIQASDQEVANGPQPQPPKKSIKKTASGAKNEGDES